MCGFKLPSTLIFTFKGFEEVASEEKALDEDVAPPKPAEVKESMTEEDLEDWLDSMIS